MGRGGIALCLLPLLTTALSCPAQGMRTAGSHNEINIFVPATDNICLIDFPDGIGAHRVTKNNVLRPAIPKDEISGKYITLECDFRLSGTDSSDLMLEFANEPGYKRIITVDNAWLYEEWQGKVQAKCGVEAPFRLPIRNGYFLTRFDPAAWHCLAVSFTRDDLMIFLDNYYLWGIGRCNNGEDADEQHEGYLPATFSIASKTGADLSNIRYAQSSIVPVRKKMQVSPFNAILGGTRLITYSVHFDVNSALIRIESLPYVDSVARWMTQNPSVKLEVSGYTDSDGDAGANTVLSQQRAAAIIDRLALFGIDVKRLTAKGYGAHRPLQANDTKEGRAANRRVELKKL